MQSVAPPTECVGCGAHAGELYRCTDCALGDMVYCQQCCIDNHTHCPFHRLQKFDTTVGHYVGWDLARFNFVIKLRGHRHACTSSSQQPTDFGYASNAGDEPEDDDEGWPPGTQMEEPPSVYTLSVKPHQRRMVIIHSTGVFERVVEFCTCDATPMHVQLFRAKLFSTSETRPKSAFTFAVLDEYELSAMSCKHSADAFYRKLRSMTNPLQPGKVVVSGTLLNASLLKLRLRRTGTQSLCVSHDSTGTWLR